MMDDVHIVNENGNYHIHTRFHKQVRSPVPYLIKILGVDYEEKKEKQCKIKRYAETAFWGPNEKLAVLIARFLRKSSNRARKIKLKIKDMKKWKKQFKIIVLEDNEFYNTILTRQLKSYTNEITIDKKCSFEIESYTNANDCVRNLKEDTDIAIIDYYLGESKNALDILKVIKEKCNNCKVIIISQFKNLKTYYQTLNEGAYHFIFKDSNALSNSCYVIEDIVNESLRRGT